MKLNNMLDELLDLAKQENEPNRYAHSEEYNKLYDELDRKTLIIDELEEQLGCPLEVREKALQQGYIYNGFTKLLYICCRYDENGCYLTNSCNKYYLKEYKITWWLKEDKSE